MSALLVALLAAVPPTNLLRESGFDLGGAGGPARWVDAPRRALRFEREGSCLQEVLIAGPGPYSVAVDMRTAGVAARPNGGFAYAAVYQLDAGGQLVEFRDFVQLTGDHDWQRHTYSVTPHPAAKLLSVRCGLFNADGVAEFAGWTMVEGPTPMDPQAVREPTPKLGPTRRAALLDDASLSGGRGSSPAVLAAILERSGLAVDRLNAARLAAPDQLTPERYDLLVLPDAPRFPAAAADRLRDFLHRGGALVSLGGYPFSELLERAGDAWIPADELAAREEERLVAEGRTPLPDSGFETTAELPLGGEELDGRWRRTIETVALVDQGARQGRRCARIEAPAAGEGGELYAGLPAVPGVYEASGWIKTASLSGVGHAFLAVYQFDANDQIVDWRDFAAVRSDRDWTRFVYPFVVRSSAVRLRIRAGLYRCGGTVWVDDLRLVPTRGRPVPLNSATGKPGDGLELSPLQIGLFDPSAPLQRVARAVTAAGQAVLREAVTIDQPLPGWQATGVLGEQARWIPLLDGLDRYGRPRGAVAAMVVHDGGFYAGSTWIGFGADGVDLFGSPETPAAAALRAALRFVERGSNLTGARCEPRYVEPGGRFTVRVGVQDRYATGPHRVRLSLRPAGGAVVATRELEVGATGETELALPATDAPLWAVEVELLDGADPVDRLTTGLVAAQPAVLRAAPALRFAGNQFTLDGRPQFLFGTDTYAYTYLSRHEDPQTWSAEHAVGRDFGLDLYENLQYAPPVGGFSESAWADFRAMAQLTQQHELTFMPGLLIGHNVAIGPAELARQSALCADYARRLGDTPNLLWYLNGDYQMRPDHDLPAVRALWQAWLLERYGTVAAVTERWGGRGPEADGLFAAPPPRNGRWDDLAAVDWLTFQTQLTRRWNNAHVAAVRRHDPDHPITSEYYQFPFDGMDLRLSIGDQDVSNIGYFDEPERDLELLPLRLAWNDLRARGKGVSLGEYGVKTHPAWTVERGGTHYHIARDEAQQQALFEAVAGYTLAYGGCKIQSWCLSDSQQRVFPWGMFYPHRMIPKDVAFVHRNLSLLFRFLEPRDAAPRVAVCLPSAGRLGADGALGFPAAYRAFDTLLARRVPFWVFDDVEPVPPGLEAVLLPSPAGLSDEAYERLKAWVESGGRLLVTGDISRDEARRPTREARLAELCGVRLVERLEPGGAQPIRVEPDGLRRSARGRGSVLYSPLALEATEALAADRRQAYDQWLAGLGAALRPPDWLSAAGDLLARPTRTGVVYLAGGARRTEPFSLFHVGGDGGVRWLLHSGAWAPNGRPVLTGDARLGAVSLDARPLAESERILLLPFSTGTVELAGRAGAWRVHVGDLRDGRWTTLEERTVETARLTLDEDLRRALLILARPGDDAWRAEVAAVLTRPWEREGW